EIDLAAHVQVFCAVVLVVNQLSAGANTVFSFAYRNHVDKGGRWRRDELVDDYGCRPKGDPAGSGVNADQPQARKSISVCSVNPDIRVFHWLYWEIINPEEIVANARFVDHSRAKGVNVLNRNQSAAGLLIGGEAGDVNAGEQRNHLRRVQEEDLC